MSLTRLTNLISTRNGRMIYVNPDDFNATDAISNSGNSPTRPFKTIQRALLEVARFSYVSGSGNDKYDQFTINLSPGDYVIDNRPGKGTAAEVPELNDQSNFDVLNPFNDLYKFNSVTGGLVIPRGTSLVGMDLRKTRIRPRYVPNPLDDNLDVTSIFKVTGACYFWQFSLFDSLPLGDSSGLGGVYNSPNSTTLVNSDFSHHKVTCFVYADQSDLDLFYAKAARAFASIPDAPSDELASRTQENRIVGPLQQSGQKNISAITIAGSSATITTSGAHEIFLGQQVTIENITGSFADLNGTYYVKNIISDTIFSIAEPKISTLASGVIPSLNISNAIVKAEIDTVDSSSPYIFNCSLRSTYGLCGLWADGSKVTGFKSMVVAQFTGVSLQKDDNAFLKFTETTTGPGGVRRPSFVREGGSSDAVALHQDSTGYVYYRQTWRNYHIRVSNSAFIQSVSVFAVGYAEQHLIESGGDYSITNSNSNFGTQALIADGFRSDAFELDKKGYVSHIVPPQSISTIEEKVPYYPLDIQKSKVGIAPGGTGTRIYLFAQTDPDETPVFNINQYKFGGRINDKIYVNLTNPSDGRIQEYSANINPSGIEEHQITSVTPSSIDPNVITPQDDTFVTSTTNNFETATPVRIYSSNGYLPLGMEANKLYYVVRINSTTFKIAPTADDARAGAGGSTTSIVKIRSEKPTFSTLTIKAYVGDTNPDLPRFDISANVSTDSFSTGTYNHGFSTGDRIFFRRIKLPDGTFTVGALPKIQSGGLTAEDLSLTVEYYAIVVNSKTFRIATSEANAVSGTFIPIDTAGSDNQIRVYRNIQKSPLKYSPEQGNWYISVDSGVTNQIHPVLTSSLASNIYANPSLTNTENSYINRISDNRSNPDRTYRLRYVIPKSTLNSRPPLIGYVIRRKTDGNNNIIPYNTQNTSNQTLDFERIYYIYKIDTVLPHIPLEQDGVYYLTILLADVPPSTIEQFNSPSNTFDFLKYSQDVSKIYPDLDKDNPVGDPAAAKTVADNLIHGLVYQNDTRKSITKECLEKFIVDCGYNPTLVSLPGKSVSGQENRLIAFQETDPSPQIQIELRRTSQVRAGNQTFEYTGFGSGNYSTGFPSKQQQVLNDKEVLYSQAQRRRAGIVFYSGLNAYGDLYVGNQKINAITGEVEIIDEPILTISGDIAVEDAEYVPYINGTKNVEIKGNLTTNGIQENGLVIANVFNNESNFNEGVKISTKDASTVNRALLTHDVVYRPKSIPLETPFPSTGTSGNVKQTVLSLTNITPNPGIEGTYLGDLYYKNTINSATRRQSYIYTGQSINNGWAQAGLVGVGHLTSIEESYTNLVDVNDPALQKTSEPYQVTGKFGINKSNPSASLHVGTGNSIFDNNVTISSDLAVNGGDITTTAVNFNLLNQPTGTFNIANAATIVSGFSSASTIDFGSSIGTFNIHNATVVLDGDLRVNGCDITTACTTFNLLNQPTTINAFSAGTNVNIGAATGTTTIKNNLQVDGNLRISGSTTTVNSTVTTIKDPVITLGSENDNAVLTNNDGKDRGIEFRYYDTSSKLGFFGWDNSASRYNLLKDATNTSEVFTGTDAELKLGKIRVTDAAEGWTYDVNPFATFSSGSYASTGNVKNADDNFIRLVEKYAAPVGVVAMWAGSISSIPNGWALCDGSIKRDRNGNAITLPDLRERFIVGAGGDNSTVSGSGYSIGNTGGTVSQSITTSNNSVEPTATSTISGGISGHALTRDQIPQHRHGNNHFHTITQTPHAHTIGISVETTEVNGDGGANVVRSVSLVETGAGTGAVNANITVNDLAATYGAGDAMTYSGYGGARDAPDGLNSLGPSSARSDFGAEHSHSSNFSVSTTLNNTTHTHSFTIDVRPPYFALAFIYKL